MYDIKRNRSFSDSDELLKHYGGLALRHIAAAAAGFITSAAVIEGLSPFGAALAAGIFPEYIPAAVLGSSAGYFALYGVSVLTLRYIAACAVAGILAYVLKRSLKRQYHKHFSAGAGFFSVFATGLVMSLSIALSADEIILYLTEGLMAGATAYFTDCCININPGKRLAARLSAAQTAGVLTLFSIGLLALSHINFSFFSLSVVVGAYVVLTAATYGGQRYGAFFGVCAGVIFGFGDNPAFITGGTALGGLLSSVFSRKNRFIASMVYILTLCLTAFSSDDISAAAGTVISSAAAALLFIATPKKVRKAFISFFALSGDGLFLSGQRRALKMRLRRASEGMEQVASTVKGVAGIYKKRSTPRQEQIYDNVCSSVCRDCSLYDRCWNESYSVTYRHFTQIIEAIKKNSSPGEKDIPYSFFTSCKEAERVIGAICGEVGKYRAAMRETVKTGETVNIVSDQFGSVAGLLKSYAATMDSGERYDPERSEIVRNALKNDFSLPTESCGVFLSPEEKLFAEICIPYTGGRIDAEGIREGISDLLGRVFENPVVKTLSDGCVSMSLCEKTKYRVIFGGCQISSGGENWCGDTFNSFYDGKGRFYAVLSDGMGTGKKAAADSVMCCSLAVTLLKSGFPVDCIIKMINSAMLIRSGEESLATLDIAAVNLYTGEVELFKAGASFSLIMKHLKLLKAEKPSLPVGILRDVEFEKIALELRSGDSCVMMSDGVTAEAASMWREILKNAPDMEGGDLADKLAKTALLNAGKDKSDDITVLTAVLTLNED